LHLTLMMAWKASLLSHLILTISSAITRSRLVWPCCLVNNFYPEK
jgi:hypothetical protein